MEFEFVSMKKAMDVLGLSKKTLQTYDKEGKIETMRTPGGWRKFNISKYLKDNNIEVNKESKKRIIYCRVSGYDKKDELAKQIDTLQQKYPTYEVISDIGSGINFKRNGLKKIMDYAINNKLDEVVIEYKDRLCRIGFDLIEHILTTYSNAKIVIENEDQLTINNDLAKDLIEIITIYNSKSNI